MLVRPSSLSVEVMDNVRRRECCSGQRSAHFEGQDSGALVHRHPLMFIRPVFAHVDDRMHCNVKPHSIDIDMPQMSKIDAQLILSLSTLGPILYRLHSK